MSEDYELSVTHYIAAPPEKVWQVMTERLTEWWCPKPWTTEVIEQDWRPGGRSAMVMRGPDGEEHPIESVCLEFTPGKRFVFTDAYKVGWIPQKPFMTGWFEIAPEGDGTRYTAGARHWDEQSFKQHQDMGFEAGWSAVADQLAGLCEEKETV
jgi:uncharacterized protein YndB with AHSA1/START domain